MSMPVKTFPPQPLRSVCVFSGSSPGVRPCHGEMAAALGRALARRDLTLVFGGSHCGLMGVLADATLAAGGKVVGVMPQALVAKERAHLGLTELVITEDMASRKAAMAERSDAFVALPGGYGTLDELFEMVTWAQLGFHRKPLGLLNSGGFWDGMIGFLAQVGAEGFIGGAGLALVQCEGDPEALLDRLALGAPDPEFVWKGQPSGG